MRPKQWETIHIEGLKGSSRTCGACTSRHQSARATAGCLASRHNSQGVWVCPCTHLWQGWISRSRREEGTDEGRYACKGFAGLWPDMPLQQCSGWFFCSVFTCSILLSQLLGRSQLAHQCCGKFGSVLDRGLQLVLLADMCCATLLHSICIACSRFDDDCSTGYLPQPGRSLGVLEGS
jgi:hypothetical protein